MKFIVLTVLITCITEAVSQEDVACPITGETRVALGNDPQLVCECTGSSISDTVWWCFGPSTCEQSQGLADGSDYAITYEFNDVNTGTSKLTIIDIKQDDVGTYTCRSTNGASFSHEIDVFADVIITLEPDGNAELKYGEDLELSCTIVPTSTTTTSPDPIWNLYDDTTEPPTTTPLVDGKNYVDADNFVTVKGGKLTIKDGNIQHAGTFRCTPEKLEGYKGVTLWTKVDITADYSVKVTEGKDAEMICKARSSPKPVIKWYIGNSTVEETTTEGNTDTQDDQFTRTSTYTISKAMIRQVYRCEASNVYASDTQDILLRVRDKLAWLWPFLVILGVSIILAIIFITLHFKEGQDDGDEEDEEDDATNPMITGKSKNSADADA